MKPSMNGSDTLPVGSSSSPRRRVSVVEFEATPLKQPPMTVPAALVDPSCAESSGEASWQTLCADGAYPRRLRPKEVSCTSTGSSPYASTRFGSLTIAPPSEEFGADAAIVRLARDDGVSRFALRDKRAEPTTYSSPATLSESKAFESWSIPPCTASESPPICVALTVTLTTLMVTSPDELSSV